MITAEEQADYDSFPSPVATTAPLLSIAEQTPTGPQTQPKTATTRAQPGTSTQVKPADPEKQAPAQAQPQAQAQIRPPAPAQPPRPVPPYFPQPRLLTLEGLDACLQNLYRYLMRIDSRIFQRVKPLIAKQAQSQLLDRVANFCGLEREDPEEQKRVMGMTSLLSRPGQSHNNNLALPWHSVADKIADLNLKIVNDHINKRMKSYHPAKSWGAKDFFTGIGYPTVHITWRATFCTQNFRFYLLNLLPQNVLRRTILFVWYTRTSLKKMSVGGNPSCCNLEALLEKFFRFS